MAKSKFNMKANFRLAKDAAHDTVEDAIKKAINEGAETTRHRIDKQASARGYLLHSNSVFEDAGKKDGTIGLGARDEFWWHFFEYGTPTIPAMPMLRPGHRKAKKVFRDELGDQLEKRIKRKAGM